MTTKAEERRQQRAVTMTPEFTPDERHNEAIKAVVRRLLVSASPDKSKPFPSYVTTQGLWGMAGSALTQTNVGHVLHDLYNWGYLGKINLTRPAATLTPKGWAYVIWLGLVTQSVLPRAFKSRNMIDTAISLSIEFAKTARDEGETLPGLPVYDDELEAVIRNRAKDTEQVDLALASLVKHYSKPTVLPRMDSDEVNSALIRFFSPEDIIRADIEVARSGTSGLYRRELVSRLSAAGGFKPDTLAGVKGVGDDHGHPALKGVGKIEEALNIQSLEAAGRGQGMPGQTTLGDVHDRLSRESVQEMTPETDDTIRPVRRDRGNRLSPVSEDLSYTVPPSHGEEDPHEGLSMTDWIGAKVQQMLDRWTFDQSTVGYTWVRNEAAKIARKAALKGFRQGQHQATEELTATPARGTYRNFTGSVYEVKRDDLQFAGIPMSILFRVEGDNDPEFNENFDGFVESFIGRGMYDPKYNTPRYNYPPGSTIRQVGEVMEAKIGYGLHSIPTVFLVGMAGGITALLGAIVVLVMI